MLCRFCDPRSGSGPAQNDSTASHSNHSNLLVTNNHNNRLAQWSPLSMATRMRFNSSGRLRRRILVNTPYNRNSRLLQTVTNPRHKARIANHTISSKRNLRGDLDKTSRTLERYNRNQKKLTQKMLSEKLLFRIIFSVFLNSMLYASGHEVEKHGHRLG